MGQCSGQVFTPFAYSLRTEPVTYQRLPVTYQYLPEALPALTE